MSYQQPHRRITSAGPVKYVFSQSDLRSVASRLGVRSDWHEPDEQRVTAIVTGHQFDNAGASDREINVHLYKNGRQVARVNLATLFALAAGTMEAQEY